MGYTAASHARRNESGLEKMDLLYAFLDRRVIIALALTGAVLASIGSAMMGRNGSASVARSSNDHRSPDTGAARTRGADARSAGSRGPDACSKPQAALARNILYVGYGLAGASMLLFIVAGFLSER